MPYQIRQLIEGKGMPICVSKNDTVSRALALMIEHDFSQLPVIRKDDNADVDVPEGMITYEGILRGIRNFKANIEDLKVRDVMVSAPVNSLDDDLFDTLERLRDTNAVLIDEGYSNALVGIVTSYDTAEYFRNRTEDLMRVEDIELMVKEFIRLAYTEENDQLDESRFNGAITRATSYRRNTGQAENQLLFDDLTLNEYITMLLYKDTWAFFEPIFGVRREFVNELLAGVREIRNALAHFRGDITIDQRDRLKFGMDWLSRCFDEYQAQVNKGRTEKIIEAAIDVGKKQEIGTDEISLRTESPSSGEQDAYEFVATESESIGGRYGPLADWLQSQPGRVDTVQLTFNQIEEILKSDLPASAHSHRAWWANDSVGHIQSQQWLEAGWRTTSINFSQGKVTFTRIQQREKAYIAFFSKLLEDLRKKAQFILREASPDGASWIVIKTIRGKTGWGGLFVYAFSRSQRFRVELYIDVGDKTGNKQIFDELLAQKDAIEAKLGPITWERLENKRASRLAIYHKGHILDEKGHAELRKWAVETMINFHAALAGPYEQALEKVTAG